MIDKAIIEFDEFLSRKGLNFEGVIIGGAALLILKISDRQTRDVDCLYPEIPDEIKQASIDFSRDSKTVQVEEDWLNNGPSSLVKSLPQGWEKRLQPLFKGKALSLNTLGRADLLKTKLFAYCDRTDPDFSDLLKLKPTAKEILDSSTWVKNCDANLQWPEHVEKMFNLLKEALNE
ncbi:MAG: DUF6036 family nucleotidyltransferase [Bdellovibrionales bacterium]